ncbi:DUF2097 family protein [Methanocaldococcus lauensis]|uniref:DUF2097 family protein n=1 Tax=Methanocaldococcus lauensis TaxID=2546128 RepID=UPI001BDCD543|nr:DUF2097 family protein [Methanocaldococcus lauensis]
MEEFIDIKNPEEIFDYFENIDYGEYVEIYFGRVHVEGKLLHYDEGFLRILNKKFGIIELDLESILEDILEVVHTTQNKRVVLRFY